MDIISMQIANKVIKRMNREYNGILETVVAVQGQTEVSITKDFGTTGHTLEIHVDGIKAIEGKDFAIKDSKTVVFSEPLQKGNIVAFSTSVAGIPRFNITNPPYDDSEVKKKIEYILLALDDNKDGIITDTIANLRKQWLEADDSVKDLVKKCASLDSVKAILDEVVLARGDKDSLKTKLDAIISMIPSSYNDTAVKTDIKTLQDNLSNTNRDLTLANTDITNIKNQIGTSNTAISDLINKVGTIDDVKKQLESATDKIQTQVNSKVSTADMVAVTDKVTNLEKALVDKAANVDVENATAKLNKLEIAIGDKANKSDVTELNGKVTAVETGLIDKASSEALTQLTSKVSVIENKKIEDFEITDSATGTKYRLKVSNGSLSIEPIKPIVPPQTEKPAETPNTKPTENPVSN